jgi:hypothetical protein
MSSAWYKLKRQMTIVAPPGSGKSFLVARTMDVIDTDNILAAYLGNAFIYDPEIYDEGSVLNRQIQELIDFQLKEGKSIVSNLDLKKLGYDVDLSFVYEVDEYFDHCLQMNRADITNWGKTPEEIMVDYPDSVQLEIGDTVTEYFERNGDLSRI